MTGHTPGVLSMPEPPTANHRHIRRADGGLALDPRAVAWREAAHLALIGARWAPHVDAVSMQVDWFRGRRRGDLDNILKAVLDGLQAGEAGTYGAFRNDAQVVHLVARRIDNDPAPRVEVRVAATEWRGSANAQVQRKP